MRDVNLTGPGGIECWISVLPPQPVGPNVDRWRKQMGYGPANDAEIAALPRVPMLGGQALEVDLTSPAGDKRLLGRMLLGDDRAVFLRITGTPDAVEAQRSAFEAFCASLRDAGGETAAAAPGAMGSTGGSSGDLAWETPSGWQQQPGSAFKLASFEVAPGTQAWISVLGGDGGGLAANVARWCGQVGSAPMTADQIQALPKLSMLGRHATLVELARDGQDQGLIVTVCSQPELGRTVFVKLQGPVAAVRAHEEAFKQFCASITTKGD